MVVRSFRIGLLAVLSGLLLNIGGTAHAQSSPYVTVSGLVYFDQNGNGRREANEPLLSNIQIKVQGAAPPSSASARQSTGDGSYYELLLPGTYTIQAELDDPFTGSPPGQPVLVSSPRTITVTATNQTNVDLAMTLPATPHDARYFPQTGYRIDDDVIWNYFNARGGVTTFGYPVSRIFPFLGFWTQIFQREMIQIGGQGGASARPMNLLDPDLMPITSLNFSTFPAYDASLTQQAPPPSTADYADAIVAFVQQHAPDTFDSQPVNFYRTFTTTVSLQTAYPNGGGNPGLLPLLNLEIWGAPTSQPAADPKNHNFVYLRFQRGIMHFDAGCHCTQGILLADAFKSVLTGQNLPADVALQMTSSPYLKLDDPTQVDAVARAAGSTLPRVQGETDLAFAFIPVSS